jgi:hypothetical protein
MRPLAAFLAVLVISGCGSSTHTASTAETNPTGMTSSTPTGLTIPAKVTPIRREGSSYTIGVLDRSTPVTYSWRCGSLTGTSATWRRPCNGTLRVTVLSKTWRCTATVGGRPICLKR